MKAFRHFLAPIFCTLLALPSLAGTVPTTFEGRCVRVLDGDTIEVLHGGAPERIRLNGIDCPEKKQSFGMRAKAFTASLVFGREVQITAFNKDRYGRTIGEVTLNDGRDVNYELVKNGYAWWYRQYSKDDNLARLEESARVQHLGLWSAGEAIPPWEFRHRRG